MERKVSMTENNPGTELKVTMLGDIVLETDFGKVSGQGNRSQKIWSVIAYLILHRNRAISVSELIDIFWADGDGANPVNALKTLLFRVRGMLAPLFASEIQPILAYRGTYQWNESITCQLDVDQFELFCRAGDDQSRNVVDRIDNYWKALEIYHQPFLSKFSDHFWVISSRTRYHTHYLSMVKECSNLLLTQKQYQKAEVVCSQALRLEPLEEEINICYIRALLFQGKYHTANQQYATLTEQIYEQLGVNLSAELRALYEQMMVEEHELETDLEIIEASLQEAMLRPGAFFCEFGFFKEFYRLEARRAARSTNYIQVVLITITLNGKIPPLKILNTSMKKLQVLLQSNLRRGDVVAKYSPAQFVIMLSAANDEESKKIMDRIISLFYEQYHRNIRVSYKIRGLKVM